MTVCVVDADKLQKLLEAWDAFLASLLPAEKREKQKQVEVKSDVS